MNKLQKTAARFTKILKKISQAVTATPQLPTGYAAILAIHNASKQMKNEITNFPRSDEGIYPKVNNICQNASKFLWIAAYKGITASTSARYHGLINQGLSDLVTYANNKKSLDENMLARNPYEANIYTTVLASSKKLSNALANFNPVSMPAQIKPKAQAPEAPYGSVESVPFGPPEPPATNIALTGPPKKFDFGKFNPANVPSGQARISNRPEEQLPLSEREKELEKWKTPR